MNAGRIPRRSADLLDSGDHLVVKQPEAKHVPIGPAERAEAAGKLGCSVVSPRVIRGELRVIWHRENQRAWFLGDLHPGNVMRNAEGEMTIIDALAGEIPRDLISENPDMGRIIDEVKGRIEGGDDGQMDLF